MSIPDDDAANFRALMRDFITGDPVAGDRLCRGYQQHILRVVRRRLMGSQRIQVDSLDVVNDVWASFFAQPPAGRQFDRPDALAAYLCRMAANKVGLLRRGRDRLKADAGRLQRLSDCPELALAAPTPTPSQIVGAEDQWRAMLDGRPVAHQRILRLLRQGLTHQEIAVRLRTNEKTIRRLVRRVQLASES